MKMNKPFEKGLIQVYTGNSKGKTTAALGLTLRAVGHGFKVCIIQFLKGSMYTGELFSAQRLYPNVEIYQFGKNCPYASLIKDGFMKCIGCGECFVMREKITPVDREIVSKAVRFAEEVVLSQKYDIVVLDEISHGINVGLIDLNEVLKLLNRKPERVELVLTGRNMPEEIIEAADLVTEMVEIKHPFKKGIPSRRGIEY
jgi:cob(I)alamin adenosyltransferase